MTAFICLVRGVNVGGHNRLPMVVLRSVCTSLGLEDVQTYLQSGNVVFRGGAGDRASLVSALEDQIRKQAGIDVRVVLRTASELKKAIAANPLPDAAKSDPAHMVIVFLGGKPSADAAKTFLATHTGPEEIRLIGSELYVNYSTGMARSKLTNVVIEKRLGVTSTARNWNSVTQLLKMAEAIAPRRLRGRNVP